MLKTFAVVFAVFILAGAAAWAADAKAGQAVYDQSCKACHGPDGTANPAVAKMLKADIKDLKSAEVQAMSADDVKKIITEGKDKMKPVKTVTGKSVDDVVAYVKTLKK